MVAVVVGLVVVLAGCAVRGADPALTPIAAAPASVDPATTAFTCPGVPDASVKAVLGEVSLPPTMWKNDEDGTVRNLDCEGLAPTGGGFSRLFSARFGRNVPGLGVPLGSAPPENTPTPAQTP
ncbi:hypothetical protein [Actinomyces sp. oral taxon 414]|uniref:hypothetical protein n=1 Tax=Actinomyces sp. oral taxon 414 TaxID=712122 RepID=UPI0012EEDD66|nr:hypothetical protein [Actinomyces sp. oral taxon 414]